VSPWPQRERPLHDEPHLKPRFGGCYGLSTPPSPIRTSQLRPMRRPLHHRHKEMPAVKEQQQQPQQQLQATLLLTEQQTNEWEQGRPCQNIWFAASRLLSGSEGKNPESGRRAPGGQLLPGERDTSLPTLATSTGEHLRRKIQIRLPFRLDRAVRQPLTSYAALPNASELAELGAVILAFGMSPSSPDHFALSSEPPPYF